MFANLKNNVLTVNSYRFPDAQVTTLDDIMLNIDEETGECLTAIIDSRLDIFKNDVDEYIAEYTGVTGSDELAYHEEAHHIYYVGDDLNELVNKCNLWGADLEKIAIYVDSEEVEL